MTQPGRVYLVGSGPGDPGLLTLRAAQLLAEADVVLYDYLVNPQVLSHARAGAELVCLGRHGRDRVMPQTEINERMIQAAGGGKCVVRLKAGDSIVFARAAEEIEILEAAGVPYEIVPGITAALAVGSYAGIPLTHGLSASAVALVTGQEREDKSAPGLDYGALATFPGTLVFYMGVTTAKRWTAALILAGKSSATPAAIVRRCSWPDQQTIPCTLGTVADEIEARHLRPPALVIVGAVAATREGQDWFSARPLSGQRIVVTRPAHQSSEFMLALSNLGALVHSQPAIEIGPPDDWAPVDAAIARIADFDWLVFSSVNGVRALLDRLLAHRDLRALGGLRLAAIGPGTADELARYHLRADLVPSDYRAESLAAALAQAAAPASRFLLVRASRGREILAEELSKHAAEVEQVVVYSSRDVLEPDPEVLGQLRGGAIDWITVTSSAIARSLVRMFGNDLRGAKLASISPVTSETLRSLGFDVAAEAEQYTTAGLIKAILRSSER
ncbi:MAG TPA: uroporphyrinogen-III C-methyltransferase [Pirellulales bacterium]|jgi:uroporphyrinogen III methyltransferase/synthase|nr:uroporphyrinogen-III C-methyltransferase [Pirellulales bacterium]